MNSRDLDPDSMGNDEDWEGNNAAFTCPECGKVFLVSGSPVIHGGLRRCPGCGKSEAWIEGGRKNGGRAGMRWGF